MSRTQTLRVLVNQRLNAAVEEIFGLVEKTIEEYEEEIDRQRRLLQRVLKPEIHVNKGPPHLVVCREDAPSEQQQWSSISAQEDPEPRPIKEDQKELWTSQDGEPLQWQEEEQEVNFSLSPVQVKSENEETPLSQSQEAECPVSNSTQQMKIEANSEGSASDINLGAASEVQLFSSACQVETEYDDGDWMKTKSTKRQSGLNTRKNNNRSSHTNSQIRGKISICKLCGEIFPLEEQLSQHMIVHSEKKAFSCSYCGKGFHKKAPLQVHMKTHTGERVFKCSVCGNSFMYKLTLQRHMTTHTGEKPFGCSVCGKRFGLKGNLTTHMRLHTGEKPYSCSVCGKQFVQKNNLTVHMRFHTGERPYGCSRCGRKFSRLSYVKSHKCRTDKSAGKCKHRGAEQNY